MMINWLYNTRKVTFRIVATQATLDNELFCKIKSFIFKILNTKFHSMQTQHYLDRIQNPSFMIKAKNCIPIINFLQTVR